jgi:hypothetical protein
MTCNFFTVSNSSVSFYLQVACKVYKQFSVGEIWLCGCKSSAFYSSQPEHFHICCDMSFRLIIPLLVNSYLSLNEKLMLGTSVTRGQFFKRIFEPRGKNLRLSAYM